MQMAGLQHLHANMQQAGIDRIAFRIQHNNLIFAGVFLADVSPYELAFGPVGHNLVLSFTVDRSYNVLAHLRDDALLQALMDALNLGHGRNAFRFGAFLREIDDALGQFQIGANNVPSYAEVIRCYPNIEDAHKVYFLKFEPHKKDGRRHVRQKNLDKTRLLLGQTMHDFCEHNDVSSCWSDIAPAVPVTPTLPNRKNYK